MASIEASTSKPSKTPKINIIPPIQLFIDLTQDNTKTPSIKHQLLYSSAPNAPSKTPSTRATSSSSTYSKLKSPISSTSPSTNAYLNSLISPPPRVPPSPLTQESEPMDITITLSPITLLDIQFNTPSHLMPSPPLFDNLISLNDGVESNGEWDAPEYHDTIDRGQRKEENAFTFYRMETEEISERYVTPCFLNGLEAYDGDINLENDKNLISNEFAVKLCLEHEEDDIKPGVVLGRSFLRLTNGIAVFRNRIITIYLDLNPFSNDSDKTNDSGDDWDAILEGINFRDIPKIDGLDLPPFVYNMGKKMSRGAIEQDIYERIMILQEPRLIIETLKFSDQHKKLLDSVILDKLKFDGEVDEKEATEEVIRGYKTLREKNDLRVFVLHIHIEGKYDTLKNKQEEKYSDDEEEYCITRKEMGNPIYGLKFAKYLNCDDPMDQALALQEAMNPFRKIYTVGTHYDKAGSSGPKRTRQHETVVETMLPRRGIKNSYENVAWLMEKWLKQKGVGSHQDSMIYYGQLITKIAKIRLLTDEMLNSLSASTYCRALDVTTPKELIDSNGRLIIEVPAPRVLRVAMHIGSHPSMQDLYDRMGNMEIHQGVLKRMARRKSY
nr:hypothetical protein [Tanacetum cinerariifolium]